MERSALIKAALGTIGTGSVAAPSVVAVQKTHEAGTLREQMETTRVPYVKKQVASAEQEVKRVLTELDKSKGLAQQEENKYKEAKAKNTALEGEIKTLEETIAKHSEDLKTKKEAYDKELNRLKQPNPKG